MVFSKSNVPKTSGIVRTLNSSPQPIQNATINTETVYYMQNSMIGRLMNTKKCSSCPKH
jgi:hypothetical protein